MEALRERGERGKERGKRGMRPGVSNVVVHSEISLIVNENFGRLTVLFGFLFFCIDKI